MPSSLWVRYVYTHSARAHNATQRIKLDALHHSVCHDRLAHITNYVFAQGYLPAHVRPCVYWEAPCGRRLGEVAHVEELLGAGEGCSEAKALRLVIGTYNAYRSCLFLQANVCLYRRLRVPIFA